MAHNHQVAGSNPVLATKIAAMSQEEELIDLNRMSQKDLLMQTYREVQKINETISRNEKATDIKISKLETRMAEMELSNATNKGIRMGLGIAATILSIVSLAIAVADKF